MEKGQKMYTKALLKIIYRSKSLIILIALFMPCLATGQFKSKLLSDTATLTGSTTRIDNGTTWLTDDFGHIMHIDTVTVITYCINIKTLRPKWLRLNAITPMAIYFVDAHLAIYHKYLNVPKYYKPVYSITK